MDKEQAFAFISEQKTAFLGSVNENGALDFCLLAKGDIEEIKRKLESKGAKIEMGIVERTGAVAKLDSIYLKDPDGNLVEIATPKK